MRTGTGDARKFDAGFPGEAARQRRGEGAGVAVGLEAPALPPEMQVLRQRASERPLPQALWPVQVSSAPAWP